MGATRWVVAGNDVLRKCKMDPETMEGRILLALVLAGVALGVIFLLDHVEDSAGDATETSHIIQNFINSLSILVGFSWEHCFDFGLEAVADQTPNPILMKFLFTGVVAFVITPAWRKYILVKVIQLNQLQKDESDSSSKNINMQTPGGSNGPSREMS